MPFVEGPARKVCVSRPVDEAAEQDMLLEEDELEAQQAPPAKIPYLRLALAAGVAVLAGSAAAAIAVRSAAKTASLPARVSVRNLLEGAELADVATDNVLAMRGEGQASRAAVQGQVRRSLLEISHSIRLAHPEAHSQMDKLEVDGATKKKVFGSVQKFSDPRVVSLTHDVVEAVTENSKEHGDRNDLNRKLYGKLLPKLAEVQQLHMEMFARKWHPDLEIDMGGQTDGQATDGQTRRLAGAAAADPDVRAQAQTFFEALEQEMGPRMPTAPARMLSLFSSTPDSSSQPSSSGSSGEVSFMTCLQKAVPNPMDVCKCFTDNMGEVMAVMQSVMSRATGPSKG